MKNGFTLMELLITLIIISVLSVMTIPALQSFGDKGIADTLSTALLQNIHYARSLSIVRHEPIMLVPDKGIWSYGYLIKSKSQIIRVFLNVKNSGILSWRVFPKGRAYLQFLPNGDLGAENGTFWYCFPKNTHPAWAIVVSQSGRARIVYPNAAGEVIVDSRGAIRC